MDTEVAEYKGHPRKHVYTKMVVNMLDGSVNRAVDIGSSRPFSSPFSFPKCTT